MRQLALDLSRPPAPTLENFAPGGNSEALAVLRAWLAKTLDERCVYLCGPSGSGKSHLVRALAQALQEGGRSVAQVGVGDLEALEGGAMLPSVVAIDDVQYLSAAGQAALFRLFHRLRDDDVRLLVAGDVPPAGLAVRDDVRTRLGAGLVLQLRLLSDEGEASDVVQEVFLKVFRNIASFRGQSSLKTWIYRITVNEAHNARRWFFRHRRREVELDTDPYESRNWKETIPDASRSPFDVAFDHEQAGIIEAALERINPVFRSAVVLRDITDLSYEEIAEVLGVSLGTVKSRILRGREALREELKGELKQGRALRLIPTAAE